MHLIPRACLIAPGCIPGVPGTDCAPSPTASRVWVERGATRRVDPRRMGTTCSCEHAHTRPNERNERNWTMLQIRPNTAACAQLAARSVPHANYSNFHGQCVILCQAARVETSDSSSDSNMCTVHEVISQLMDGHLNTPSSVHHSEAWACLHFSVHAGNRAGNCNLIVMFPACAACCEHLWPDLRLMKCQVNTSIRPLQRRGAHANVHTFFVQDVPWRTCIDI